ncbi:MAG: hypothetical protein WC349_02605 [Patescibacteria group bacterium]|jgi:hypothetical protein
MKTRRIIVILLVTTMTLWLTGCYTIQKSELKNNEQPIYSSHHRGFFPGPDNAISAATAYSIVEKTNAETKLIESYTSGKTSTTETEALGFIVNDRYSKWNLTIKTKIGGLTIFQQDVPARAKIEHKLKWGEYITVWTDGYNKYTNNLKVMPYADVRTIIKRGGKEEEIAGHWMTQMPQ